MGKMTCMVGKGWKKKKNKKKMGTLVRPHHSVSKKPAGFPVPSTPAQVRSTYGPQSRLPMGKPGLAPVVRPGYGP